MSTPTKNQKEILSKLRIDALNPMQVDAQGAIFGNDDVILLSPTGSGKTIAYLLPLIYTLDQNCDQIQIMIIVPSRELAIQIEQVVREMGTGYKVNAVYGGRSASKDRIELKHLPAILIGTPGRIADHLRHESFNTREIRSLVLDEFDKSLEVGFEKEMLEIINFLPNLRKRILTSATHGVEIPQFVGLKSPYIVDYLGEKSTQLEIKTVVSPTPDKLESLKNLIYHLGNQNGIVFCNFKDTIQIVSNYLTQNRISHGTFYGGMEQIDRERALIKFRNGTHHVLLATDLAARGIDVPDLDYIIHYQIPSRSEEFIHRNGRTARMHSTGTAYIIHYVKDVLPDFIGKPPEAELSPKELNKKSQWTTLLISGGRKDKISKGDIAGLFMKQGNLTSEELGLIEIKHDCAFIAVQTSQIKDLLSKVSDIKLKNKKVRVTVI